MAYFSFNDRTATLILEEERYPNGANSPTMHYEYACPCGCGRVIDERVVGFGDYIAYLDCPTCSAKYKVRTGCGHIWELIER